MTASVLQGIRPNETVQTEQAREDQVKNNAGGFVFEISPLQRFRRFLILGTEASTYYQSAPALSRENAQNLFALLGSDHRGVVNEILEVSTNGLAPRQEPTLFAYAAAVSPEFGSVEDRTYALSLFNQIVRTGTHLFTFLGFVEQFRGWGTALRRAVADWYLSKEPDKLAYQVVKYKQREGWSHRDALRLSHPKADNWDTNDIFGYITQNGETSNSLIEAARGVHDGSVSISAGIEAGLPWEALPSEALTEAKTWEALLEHNSVPLGALVRQLGRLTNLDLLKPFADTKSTILGLLRDERNILKSRIHPFNLLNAWYTYRSGRGFRGNASWNPDGDVVAALEAAFYTSFPNVKPAGKNTLVALDVSGSMGWDTINNSALTPREASAAMALVTVKTEPNTHVVAFSTSLTPLPIASASTLDETLRIVDSVRMGGTDVSLPILYAQERGLQVDTFISYTDNETWSGRIHPYQALTQYRKSSGRFAKNVVVGMTATGFSVADPRDPGSLDVVGFDSSAPSVISEFSRG